MGYTINKPTLRDVRKCGEYATLYRWNLDLSSVEAAFGTDVVDASKLNCLCESASLPSKTVDKMSIGIRGHKHYQPGRVTPNGTITFSFLETVNNPTHKLLSAWINKIWSYNSGLGGTYEQMLIDNIAIERLNNQDQSICRYNLFWCFLEDYTLPPLDGSTSGPMTTTLILSYNDFEIVQGMYNRADTQPLLTPVNMSLTYEAQFK